MRDRVVRWIVGLLVVTSLLVLLRAPMRVGFMMARPGMERLVGEIESGALAVPFAPRWIGPYRVGYSGAYNGNGVLFLTANGVGSGFAYNAERREPLGGYYNSGSDGNLSGPWYWYTDD